MRPSFQIDYIVFKVQDISTSQGDKVSLSWTDKKPGYRATVDWCHLDKDQDIRQRAKEIARTVQKARQRLPAKRLTGKQLDQMIEAHQKKHPPKTT